jgi:hypothetical protein
MDEQQIEQALKVYIEGLYSTESGKEQPTGWLKTTYVKVEISQYKIKKAY